MSNPVCPKRLLSVPAIEWGKRCPNPTGANAQLEIRPLLEAADSGAEFTPELREQEDRLQAELAGKK